MPRRSNTTRMRSVIFILLLGGLAVYAIWTVTQRPSPQSAERQAPRSTQPNTVSQHAQTAPTRDRNPRQSVTPHEDNNKASVKTTHGIDWKRLAWDVTRDVPGMEIRENPFCVSTGWQLSGTVKKGMGALFASLGAASTRIDYWWDVVEPQKGRYDHAKLDDFVRTMQGSHCDMVVMFQPVSRWATEVSGHLRPGSPPKDMEVYLHTLEVLVRRYKGKIKYWQIGNETTLPSFWAGGSAELIDLVKASYTRIKATDPEAMVLLCGFPGGGFHGQRREPIRPSFAEALLRECRGYFDILDIHLYENIHTYHDRVSWFRDKMREYGYETPIWSTECAGPDPRRCGHFGEYMAEAKQSADAGGMLLNNSDRSRVMEILKNVMLPKIKQEGCSYVQLFFVPEKEKQLDELQCQEVIKRNLMALSVGVSRIYWWTLISGGSHPIFGKMGLIDGLRKKPAYHAYRMMTEKLTGMIRIKRTSRDKVMVFEITKRNDDKVFVLWKMQDPHHLETDPVPIDMLVPFPRAVRTDVLGNTREFETRQGHLTVHVDERPVFIERATHIHKDSRISQPPLPQARPGRD